MMFDQRNAMLMYEMAKLMASHTANVGKLAGNCLTVHYGMLGEARRRFHPAVEVIIGHVEIGGNLYFHFDDEETKEWDKGTKEKYHAWQALDNEVLDLTLASTLHEKRPRTLPSNLTYMNREIAEANKITYVERYKGESASDLINKLIRAK